MLARSIAFVVALAASVQGCADEKVEPVDASDSVACALVVDDVIAITGGTFMMGTDRGYPEEGPAREVRVDAFFIDATEVTVAEFAAFADEQSYVSVAERPLNPDDFPRADPSLLRPGSAVFKPPLSGPARDFLDWWAYIPGAYWRYPDGPDQPPAEPNHPVTQIAFEDAQAYAKWRGGRLPTEAEWEFAALGGAEVSSPSRAAPIEANTWQGVFPVINSKDDGYAGVAPGGCYTPNEYGLYDMLGNVWEWTADHYAPGHFDKTRDNPTGVSLEQSRDPHNPGVPSRVIKGGSYLCAESYCARYRPAARHASDTGMGTNHIGLRVVYDVDPRR